MLHRIKGSWVILSVVKIVLNSMGKIVVTLIVEIICCWEIVGLSKGRMFLLWDNRIWRFSFECSIGIMVFLVIFIGLRVPRPTFLFNFLHFLPTNYLNILFYQQIHPLYLRPKYQYLQKAEQDKTVIFVHLEELFTIFTLLHVPYFCTCLHRLLKNLF